MSAIRKSIATAIGMTVAVISLAVIPPATATAKENRRAGNPARIHHSSTLKHTNATPGGTGLRTAASGKHRSIRRTNQSFLDASAIYGSTEFRRHRAAGIFDDPFFFDVGAVRHPKRRAKR